ncbi:chitotriosidase-1-like [Homarus americanus]|uniref:chitotriosidase-1-like n=1 Tax=Homarus americanus TaxID=6706 RepID=UPI001C44E416|nr:chitotriosidase-1-like [Homarus americanus]
MTGPSVWTVRSWVVTVAVLVLTEETHLAMAAGRNNKVVCYYSSWAHYRHGAAQYRVDDVPVELCTHVIYAFAVLDANSLTTVEHDPHLDKDQGLANYRRFLRLRSRNPQVKLLLGLGGWTDSRSDKYSRLVSNSQRRAAFTAHVVRFLQDYGFDGLDLDWEYPAYQSSAADKEGFRLWVEELRTAFSPRGLLLTAAVSASKSVIDRGYDEPAVATALDQIHLMTYDFHGSWEKQVAHHAPLFPVPGQSHQFSADFAVNHWIKKGAPPAKLVLGVPFYGRSWTLAGSDASTGAAASGPGRPGPLMKDSGSLAYYEVCLAHERDGWTKVSSGEAPHLTSDDQWVGYDDIDTVTRKAQYALKKGLGGVMIWDIAMDDFRGSCSAGVNPLLSAISRTLRGASGLRLTGPPTTVMPTRPRPIIPTHPEPPRSITSRPRPTTASPTMQLNLAECRRLEYTADLVNCDHFYRCINDKVFHFQCPKGLHWRQSRASCDWPKAALCKARSVT